MVYHARFALLALGSLLLGACGTSPVHPSILSAVSLSAQADNGARLVDHAGFTTEGAKWWAEAGGAKWWAEGVFQPMPGNSNLLRAVKIDVAQARAPQLGRGVVVAVIDSGVDLDPPMLKGVLLPGSDFVDNDLQPSEEGQDSDAAYGHGGGRTSPPGRAGSENSTAAGVEPRRFQRGQRRR